MNKTDSSYEVIAEASNSLKIKLIKELSNDDKDKIINLSKELEPVFGSDGILTISNHLRTFMNNESYITNPTVDIYGNLVPPATNWDDCGELECLNFDDPNLNFNS